MQTRKFVKIPYSCFLDTIPADILLAALRKQQQQQSLLAFPYTYMVLPITLTDKRK